MPGNALLAAMSGFRKSCGRAFPLDWSTLHLDGAGAACAARALICTCPILVHHLATMLGLGLGIDYALL